MSRSPGAQLSFTNGTTGRHSHRLLLRNDCSCIQCSFSSFGAVEGGICHRENRSSSATNLYWVRLYTAQYGALNYSVLLGSLAQSLPPRFRPSEGNNDHEGFPEEHGGV